MFQICKWKYSVGKHHIQINEGCDFQAADKCFSQLYEVILSFIDIRNNHMKKYGRHDLTSFLYRPLAYIKSATAALVKEN